MTEVVVYPVARRRRSAGEEMAPAWRLDVLRDALFCILADAKSLDDARRMAGEAVCDIDAAVGAAA